MGKREQAQQRAIANVLASAPGLGAFAVAVALYGLQGAVGVCETRDVSDELTTLWGTLGYTLEELPTGEDMRCLLLGIEATRRQWVANRNNAKDPVPLFVMAKDMGCGARDIHKGQLLLKSYGGDVAPARTRTGKIGAI